MSDASPRNVLFMKLLSGSAFLRCTGDIYSADADENDEPLRRNVSVDAARAAVLDGLPPGRYVFDFAITGGSGTFRLEVHPPDRASYDTANGYGDVHTFEVVS